MPTITIHLGERTDVAAEIAALRPRLADSGVNADELDEMVDRVRTAAENMVQSGKKVASVAGIFSATRDVACGSTLVVLKASFGKPLGLFGRLLRMATRRG